MEQAAITVTMMSSLVLVLSMLTWLLLMVSLIFFLNKYSQEGDLMGGNIWRKVFRKSKGFVETIDNEKEKKSVQSRLRIILLSQKIILFSLGGVAVAIFLWMMV
ncbi:MAG: hypothetical protein DCO96_06060 [Fluviicola sp. XM-24bin1]|nr:MAG: hypothetical protein DCO96_06060 [Fluviicola sp. XM-24bin1]